LEKEAASYPFAPSCIAAKKQYPEGCGRRGVFPFLYQAQSQGDPVWICFLLGRERLFLREGDREDQEVGGFPGKGDGKDSGEGMPISHGGEI
jgi:hypothetical protein